MVDLVPQVHWYNFHIYSKFYDPLNIVFKQLQKSTSKIEKPPEDNAPTAKRTSQAKIKRRTEKDDIKGSGKENEREDEAEDAATNKPNTLEFEEEAAVEEETGSCIQCGRNQETFLGMKVWL